MGIPDLCDLSINLDCKVLVSLLKHRKCRVLPMVFVRFTKVMDCFGHFTEPYRVSNLLYVPCYGSSTVDICKPGKRE